MNKNQRSAVNVPIYVFTALAIGLFAGFALKKVSSGKSMFQRSTRSTELNEVLQYINEHYVDQPDIEELEESAIVKALEELDPHSTYLPKEVLSSENEQMEGSYEGVGIQFFIKEDTINVDGVIGGGPSEEVGIRAGDKIITVGDSTVAGIGIQNKDVIRLLKGKKNTKVDVGIKRQSKDELIDFTITRAPIALNSIDVAYMLTEETGYIKINRFSTKTFKEFQIELNKLVKGGMQNLVIDLRGNGGGIMKDALQILDQLIDGKKTLLTAEGRKYKREEYQGILSGLFEEGRLAVLINESSASASEIVAGAIQDWDRGVIIGRRSFGKGLVQQPFPLSDGSGIRLTVARYYTPSGRSIQRPYDHGVKDYYEDYYKRSSTGEMLSKDSIKVDSNLVKYTLLNKRKVYGGGGIMPDIFIPVDTTSVNDFYTSVIAKRLASEYAYSYFDKNEKALKSYSTATDFENRFLLTSTIYSDFVNYVETHLPEKKFKQEQIKASKEDLSEYLKALLAKRLFDDEGYFIVMNDTDEAILRALKILQTDEYNTILNHKVSK